MNRRQHEHHDNSIRILELAEEIRKESFFHDIEIDGIRTGTNVYGKELPPNYYLFPVFELLANLDLSQARCIDIGTFDGMTAFVMAELGAKSIDATCQYDLTRFRLIHELGNWNNLNYHPEVHLHQLLERFGEGSFDLACISAMLHHLMNPLDALFIARLLLRREGYLILEAAIRDLDGPVVLLNTEDKDPVYGTPTVWIPSYPALVGMAKLAAFEVSLTYHLTGTALGREANYRRVTLLCRAERPSQVKERTPQLKALHEHAPWTGLLDFKRLEAAAEERAEITYSGPTGQHDINIWTHVSRVPLQPKWRDPHPSRTSCFRLGTNDEFLRLMGVCEADQWTAKDITLLAAKYPGEIFPEGQVWSRKQFGNLFCLEFIRRWDLRRVIEIGAGFNHYFENHLPRSVEYSVLDEPGFYDEHLIGLANKMRQRSKFVQGLIGRSEGILPNDFFDALFSVSVIEHIPAAQVAGAAKDMFRVLQPGGWIIHALDLNEPFVPKNGRLWLNALREVGFLIDDDAIDLEPSTQRAPGKEIFLEPMSIMQRFCGGYSDKPWREPQRSRSNRGTVMLIAARKPLQT